MTSIWGATTGSCCFVSAPDGPGASPSGRCPARCAFRGLPNPLRLASCPARPAHRPSRPARACRGVITRLLLDNLSRPEERLSCRMIRPRTARRCDARGVRHSQFGAGAGYVPRGGAGHVLSQTCPPLARRRPRSTTSPQGNQWKDNDVRAYRNTDGESARPDRCRGDAEDDGAAGRARLRGAGRGRGRRGREAPGRGLSGRGGDHRRRRTRSGRATSSSRSTSRTRTRSRRLRKGAAVIARIGARRPAGAVRGAERQAGHRAVAGRDSADLPGAVDGRAVDDVQHRRLPRRDRGRGVLRRDVQRSGHRGRQDPAGHRVRHRRRGCRAGRDRRGRQPRRQGPGVRRPSGGRRADRVDGRDVRVGQRGRRRRSRPTGTPRSSPRTRPPGPPRSTPRSRRRRTSS